MDSVVHEGDILCSKTMLFTIRKPDGYVEIISRRATGPAHRDVTLIPVDALIRSQQHVVIEQGRVALIPFVAAEAPPGLGHSALLVT